MSEDNLWICIECKEDIGEGCKYVGPGMPKNGIICPATRGEDMGLYHCNWILVTGTVDRHGSRYV